MARRARSGPRCERRGIAGEDGTGLAGRVKITEHFLFHGHIFEHGLDNHVSVVQIGVFGAAGKPLQTGVGIRLLEFAAFDADIIKSADRLLPACKCFVATVQQVAPSWIQPLDLSMPVSLHGSLD